MEKDYTRQWKGTTMARRSTTTPTPSACCTVPISPMPSHAPCGRWPGMG